MDVNLNKKLAAVLAAVRSLEAPRLVRAELPDDLHKLVGTGSDIARRLADQLFPRIAKAFAGATVCVEDVS